MSLQSAVEASATAPCVPLSSGTIAFYVGKGRLANNAEHTHKWTVFVRGAQNQDITYAVSKVVFTLHPSFEEHVRGEPSPPPSPLPSPLSLQSPSGRPPLPPSPSLLLLLLLAVLTSPPFQVSETGWGAFEIGIEVHLHDAAAAPLRLTHLLKLFPEPGSAAAAATASGTAGAAERPVLSEHYDELVFNVLPEEASVRAALLAGPVIEPPPYPYQEFFGVFSPEADLTAIAAARKWLVDRAEELEERLIKARAAKAALQHKHLPDLGVA